MVMSFLLSIFISLLSTLCCPQDIQAISGRPRTKQNYLNGAVRDVRSRANINDVRDYHMSWSCPTKIIDDEYK